jgi:phosphoglycerol transferase MdoB-like AlkP superfamily enzyme
MLNHLRPLVLFFRPFAVAYVLLGAFLRLGLWRGLCTALALGFVNDAIQAIYLSLPFLLAFLCLPKLPSGTKTLRATLSVLSFLGVGVALFVSIAEILFWEEFESRFNLIAVDYLIYPTEVLGNIWESYPMPLLLTGLSVGTLAIWWPLWRRGWKNLTTSSRNDEVKFSRRRGLLTYCSIIAPLALFFSSESLSVSPNRAVNELSKNGIASFFRAARSQEIEYHQFYKTLPDQQAYQRVRDYYTRWGAQYSEREVTNLVQRHASKSQGLGKLNVVLLVQESLGAQFVGAYGDTRGLTPFLDQLAKESLMFRNAYATGTRTVRGLEAIVASFPPIPSESIVKRAGCDNISNWGSVMRKQGYETSFIYGGYGAFDNMNAFFGGNGFSLQDRLDIRNPRFGNIWGASDEDLYSHAITYFDNLSTKRDKPFFSVVLSTSNHKPFTFREGVPGVPPSGGGRLAGIRYADFSIGEFFKAAKDKSWFANTLFVVIADHDSRVYGRAYVPVEHYRIPVFIYAPGKIQPGVNAKAFSSMDLAPTVLSLLGLEYEAPFFGVDVIDPQVPASRPVMFSHNHNIAWYEGEQLTVIGPNKEAKSFSYREGKTDEVPLNVESADLLAAHLQTGYELFKARSY